MSAYDEQLPRPAGFKCPCGGWVYKRVGIDSTQEYGGSVAQYNCGQCGVSHGVYIGKGFMPAQHPREGRDRPKIEGPTNGPR